MNIAIIGAGPVGSQAAYFLARNGHTVSMFEEHATIGSPIQCTGLLTSTFDDFGIPMKDFLVNTTHQITITTPHQQVHFDRQKEYVVCRTKFDQYMAHRAEDAGAQVFVNHHFMQRNGKANLLVKDKTTNTIKDIPFDAVIGADGPLSKTAKEFGLFHPERKFYYGVQATVKGEFDADAYSAHFGNEVAPDLFAWVVPEDETTARVGVGTLRTSVNTYFNKFLQENNFTHRVALQSGLIPLYHHSQVAAGNGAYLIGDAATQVKATTLGGIIPGMKAAEILARSFKNEMNYASDLRSLRFQLWLHLQIRKVFDRFSDTDWDRLASLMNQEKIQHIFQQHTREEPAQLLMKAVWREPRFLSYVKHLLPFRNGGDH